MGDAEALRVVFEGIVALGVLGGLAMTLVRLGAIGNTIKTHGEAIEKMADVLVVQATQRMEIQSLRERQTQDEARADETNRRIFQAIDRMNERWQGKRTDSPP